VTGPVEERTYRWPRRYAFAVTVAVVIVVLVVLLRFA
jgi:hypothetical protein